MAVQALSFHDLLGATCHAGTLRLSIRGTDVMRLCLACDAEFDQTDEGWKALRDHEMEHGSAATEDAMNLDGKSLRIVVVKQPAYYSGGYESAEIWGVDDECGVVYYLSDSHSQGRCWKWKLTKQTKPNDGPKVMQLAAASLLNG
jgi:hypothetical protein